MTGPDQELAPSDPPERIVVAGAVDRPRRPPRPRWPGALVAGAMGVLILLAWKHAAVVAFFAPPPALPRLDPGPVPTPAPLRDEAMAIRQKAFTACDHGAWILCQDQLDHASALDPAGDAELRVQRAREAIAAATDAGPSAPKTPASP